MNELDELLREQAAYYHDQAHRANRMYESDEEYRSPELLTDGLPIIGDVLELACGGGHWTKILAARGHRVTAVDASPRMLAKAREEVAGLDVELIQADLFNWRVPRRFDTVFFGFWLSHVPARRFAGFWHLVEEALNPGGRACFVDSGPGRMAHEEILLDQPAPAARRQADNGNAYRIVKIFHEPDSLTQALDDLGWTARVWPIRKTTLAGWATPPGRSRV